MSEKQRSYHFLLPQVRKEPVGNQGEIAEYIPYRLEESLDQESILQELKAQPHLAELVRYLDPNRRIYLLECSSMEVLKLDGRLQIVDRRSVFQGGPVDLDRLLLDRERNGHLTAHPVRSGPPEDGEALEVEWLQGESDFSCERRAGVI